MRGFRLAARARVVSSGGRGRTSVERRRVGAGAAPSSSAGSVAVAGGFGRVGGGAGGAPNRSFCMAALVTTGRVCVA